MDRNKWCVMMVMMAVAVAVAATMLTTKQWHQIFTSGQTKNIISLNRNPLSSEFV